MTNAVTKKFLGSASLAALMVAGAAGSSLAGDFSRAAPSLKGSYAQRVAHVPAPAPVPTYHADWYVGLSGSFAPFSSGSISVSGDHVPAKSMDQLDGIMSGGFQIGRYFHNGWRGELSFDFRPFQSVSTGDTSFNITRTSDVPALTGPQNHPVDTTDTHHYEVGLRNEAKYAYQTGMVKGYYDFANSSRFTPFIGAGAGLTLYTFKRTASTDAGVCTHSVNSLGGAHVDPLTNDPICTIAPAVVPSSNNNVVTTWGYSLSVMAGVAVDLSENTKFDIGYQGLYTSGTVSSSIGGGSDSISSRVEIADRFDHELRVGLRWDVH
ncbi:MAG: hypothetical protein AAFR23_09810 [Pseudomonadota bacterium]